MIEVLLNLNHIPFHVYLLHLCHPDLVFGAAIFALHDKRDSVLVPFLGQPALCLQVRALIPRKHPAWCDAFLIAA
jgi:hypothetical protein